LASLEYSRPGVAYRPIYPTTKVSSGSVYITTRKIKRRRSDESSALPRKPTRVGAIGACAKGHDGTFSGDL
jgi:hypothetical protein